MNRTQRLSFALALAVSILVGTMAPPTGAQQPPAPAQEGFVPVDRLPSAEAIPAAPLLIAAYSVAWLALFLYLWSIWRRLARVEHEIAEVSRRVEASARR